MPDIMHAVSLISRYMKNRREIYLLTTKRILRYLQGTIEYGLFYKNDEKSNLFGFTDNDHADNLDDRKSTIWLKASAYAIVNRKNLVGIDCQNLISSDPHALVPIFEYKVYGTSQLPDFSGLPSPRPFTTHVPYSLLPESIESSKCRVVYICHNPGDNFVSLWRMQEKLGLNCLKTHLTCIAKESWHVVHTGSMCWDTGNKA
nr:cytosolic sulfotransferase 15-like [Coffea arabica]